MSRALGEFEQLLLFAVMRLGSGAYGVSIRKMIAERAGRDVSAGAVYTGLDRLQARGYLTSQQAESTTSRGGRPRKYYRLEREGAVALEQSFRSVRRMADGLWDDLVELAGDGDSR